MANITVIPFEEATGKLKNIYDDLIRKRGKLATVHTIQSLNPDSIIAHMELYMTLMFNQSPLSRAQREMIGVVVSAANGCEYCQQHHGAALLNYWKDEWKILQLRKNHETAGLDETDTLLCRYAIDLTLYPNNFDDENKTKELRRTGLDDRAILDVTLVAAYFNFVNRIVLALGVALEEKAGEGYKY